jgi:hypothetical protein
VTSGPSEPADAAQAAIENCKRIRCEAKSKRELELARSASLAAEHPNEPASRIKYTNRPVGNIKHVDVAVGVNRN